MVTSFFKSLFVMFFLTFLVSAKNVAFGEDFSKRCKFNQGNCSRDHGFVQDFGYGGVGSYIAEAASRVTSPIASLIRDVRQGTPNPECTRNILHEGQEYAGSAWNGTCKDATREETLALNCKGQEGLGYSQPAIQNIIVANDKLDPLQEELVFMTAVSDIHKFTKCQDGLFNQYFNPNDSTVKDEMLQNAFNQFTDLVEHLDLRSEIKSEYQMRDRQARADYFKNCIRESCQMSGSPEVFGTLRDNLPPQIEEKRKKINALLSRIPMANRDSMRAAMENLIMSSPQVTKAQFDEVFNAEMTRLNEGVKASLATIDGIYVKDPTSGQEWYCVDRELKENLQRSGQVETTVKGMGLQDALAGFTCRSANRYGIAGMVVSEMALIPSYFVGYGFARLGMRAGMSAIRAVSVGGRALATTTRAAMIGLEAADWTASIAGMERDCHNQTFFSRVEGQNCSPENEVGQVYEESSYAQCMTSVIMPFASALVGTTVRVASSPGLEKLYRAGAPARRGEEIVVTAGPKVKRFLDGDEAARAIDSLEARGIKTEGSEIRLSPGHSRTITTPERAYLLDEIVGVPLTEQATKKILEQVETGQRGLDPIRLVRRKEKVIQALQEQGLSLAEATAKAEKLLASGVLGQVPAPRIVTTPEPTVSRAAPASAPPASVAPRTERELLDQYATLQVTTPRQNETYIPRALQTRSNEGVIFLNSQNSFQKRLNDSLSDKTLVDAINSRHSVMVKEAIERELAGKYPGLRVELYSDYKAIQAAIIVRGGNNERMMSDIRKVLDNVDQAFMREIKSGEFPSIPENLRNEPWFSTGVGETGDLANVQARFPPGTTWEQIQASWVKVRQLRQELEGRFGRTPLMKKVAGEVDAKVPTAEVYALLRGSADNDYVAKVLNHRHGLQLKPEDVESFRAYAREADNFSPGLLIAKRESHDFDRATSGAVTLDFGGVGGLNAESVGEGLAQGFDLKRSVMAVRRNERLVTNYLDLIKKRTGDELKALLRRNGIEARVSVSGDDMVIIPDKPFTDEIRQQILQSQARVQAEILGRTGRNTNVRVSYVRPGIANPQDRAILAAEGEGIEKILRKKLEFQMTPAEMRTLTIGTDMRGSLRSSGDVGLLTNGALPPDRLAIIQREFRSAVEEANQKNGSTFRVAP